MNGSCKFADLVAFEVIKHFGLPKNVIELGCGCGKNLAKFSDVEVAIGIDPCLENVRRARKNCKGANIVLGSHSLLMNFNTNEFDVGYTCSVLDHMEDFRPAISELCRVCRKVMLFEPIIKGASRQAFPGETDCWKISWYHDIESWLKKQETIKFECFPKPMYKINSGQMFYQFIIDSEKYSIS